MTDPQARTGSETRTSETRTSETRMSETRTETATADWAGANGQRWAAKADRMEAQLEPINPVLLAAAALEPGEIVLDVGCGRGVSTRLAAEVVSADGAVGSVIGLDVSAELIDSARALTDTALPVEWQVGDAQTMTLPTARYDALISRFGVMFFDDATTAFTNLRTAVRPGGRLCVAVWPTRDRTPLMQVLVDVAITAAAEHGEALVTPAVDDGPFSLGNPERTRAMLATAGWADVAITDHDVPMYSGGPGTVSEVAETSMDIGVLRVALASASPAVADVVREAIVAEVAGRHDGVGFPLIGTVSIITAVNPG